MPKISEVPKEPGDTIAKGDELEKYWVPRTQRADRVWQIYQLEDKTQQARKAAQQAYFVTNEPKSMANTIMSLISSTEENYRIPLGNDTYEERLLASKIERFLKGCRRDIDDQMRARHEGRLAYANAKNIALRGWYGAARVLLLHKKGLNGRSPIDLRFWDPIEVYTEVSYAQPLRVIHKYQASVGQLNREWGYQPPKEKGDLVWVYDDWLEEDGEVWNAIVAFDTNQRKGEREQWLRKPTVFPKLKHIPIVMGPVGGGVIKPLAGKEHGVKWQADMGRDVYSMTTDVYEQVNMLFAQLAQLVDNAGMRFYKTTSPEGDLVDIGIPGATVMPLRGQGQEDVGPVQPHVATPDFTTLANALLNMVQKGGLPPFLQGIVGQYSSSLLFTQAVTAALQIIAPYLEAQIDFDRGVAQEILWQYQHGKFADWQLNVEDKRGQLIQMTFKPEDMAKRYYVAVDREPAVPRNDMEKAQIALMAKQAGLDDHTIFEKYFGIEDVELVDERKLRQMLVSLEPLALRRLEEALRKDGQDELADIVLNYTRVADMKVAAEAKQAMAMLQPRPEVLPPEGAGIPPEQQLEGMPPPGMGGMNPVELATRLQAAGLVPPGG